MDKIAMLKENLFSWYNFGENATGILYCKDKDYQTILSKKISLVEEKNQILDYIIFIGEKQIGEKLNNLKNTISENTKVIVIDENELSVQNISSYPKNKEILESSNNITIAKLKKEMENFGFSNSNIYYAFPNYNFVDMLFSKTYDIKAEQIQKYIPTVQKMQTKVINEVEFLKKIVLFDKDILDFLANSYFVEFSQKEWKPEVKYVSFNNTRKEEYRLMTIIKEEYVEKVAVNEKAKTHLENMKQNVPFLNAEKVNGLDYVEDDKYLSKLVKNHQTLDMILAEHYQDLEFIVKKFEQIKNILLENALDDQEEAQKSLREYPIEGDLLKDLKFVKNAWIDLIPKNCFEIDEQLYFFDQEWRKEFLPVDFILYRGIINCYDLVKKIDLNELYQKLNLTPFIPIFEKMNEKIMKDILDQELYEKILCQTSETIEDLINQKEIYDKQIKDFKTEDLKKDKVIKELQLQINTIKDLQEEERNKARYIKVLENIQQEKENQLKECNQMNAQKDEIINHLNEIIKVKDHQIAVYENMKTIKIIKKIKGNA